MIIDYILDREDGEKDLAAGYTHRLLWNGKTEKIAYNPKKFYNDIMGYIDGCGGTYAEKITAAMDYGTEDQVRAALCDYIIGCEYNPAICDWINARDWLVYCDTVPAAVCAA